MGVPLRTRLGVVGRVALIMLGFLPRVILLDLYRELIWPAVGFVWELVTMLDHRQAAELALLRWRWAVANHRARRLIRRSARRRRVPSWVYASIASPVGMGNDGQKAYDLATRTWFGLFSGNLISLTSPWYDVTNPAYLGGAKGNGIAGDGASINSAIGSIPVTGATLFFPSTATNVYRIEVQILVNKANVAMQFGGGATLKAANNLNADLLKITASNVLVLDGIIDGNVANQASGTAVTIDCTAAGGLVSGVTLLNTAIQNVKGYGVNIQASGAGGQVSGTNIVDGTNITTTDTGVFINGRVPGGGTVNLTTVRNAIVNGTFQHGVVSTGANRTIVEGCSLLGVGVNKAVGFAHAIAVDGNGGANANAGHRLVNNYALQPADAGIEVADGVTDTYIAGNHINGAGHGPNMVNNYGIYFGGALALSQRCAIIGNDVINSVGDNYKVAGPNGANLTDHVSLIGNVSSAPGGAHLTLTFVGTDIHVYGNPGFPADIQTTANAVVTITGDLVTNPSGAVRPFADGGHSLGGTGLRYKGLFLSQAAQRGLATLAYSASITPNAALGDWQSVTVTNATAFTINAPTNPPPASGTQELVIEVLNSSGGAMGLITWNAIFKFTGGAFVNPANTAHRFIRFEWNSAAWVETGRAAADY